MVLVFPLPVADEVEPEYEKIQDVPPEAVNVYGVPVTPEEGPETLADPEHPEEIVKFLWVVYEQLPLVAVTQTALVPVEDHVIVLVLPLPVTDEVELEYEKIQDVPPEAVNVYGVPVTPDEGPETLAEPEHAGAVTVTLMTDPSQKDVVALED